MQKIKNWLNTREEWVYINDENDEIVSYPTNGEVLFGYAGAILALILIFVVLILV